MLSRLNLLDHASGIQSLVNRRDLSDDVRGALECRATMVYRVSLSHHGRATAAVRSKWNHIFTIGKNRRLEAGWDFRNTEIKD